MSTDPQLVETDSAGCRAIDAKVFVLIALVQLTDDDSLDPEMLMLPPSGTVDGT